MSKTMKAPDASLATPESPISIIIEVAKIEVDKHTLRAVDVESEDFKHNVLNSIETNGMRAAIAVLATKKLVSDENGEKSFVPVWPTLFYYEDGPYAGKIGSVDPVKLWDGRHRIVALQILGKKDEKYLYCRAEFCGDVGEEEYLTQQVVFNRGRVETTPGQIAEQCGKILALSPMMQHGELALKMGISPSFLSQLLKINRLPEELRQKLLKTEGMTAQKAIYLAKLPQEVLNEEGEEWLEKANTMNGEDFSAKVAERRAQFNKVKKGSAKPGEFIPPSPRVRKGSNILAIFKRDDRKEYLETIGCHTAEEMLIFIVQQDEMTINAAKAEHEKDQKGKRGREAVKFMRKAADAFGIAVDKNDTPEDILRKLKESGKPSAETTAASLREWYVAFQAGKIQKPTPAEKQGTKAKKKGKKGKKGKKAAASS